jgi:ABC-type Fe3+-hydroxamate transport system substrate-binding protein
MEEAKDSGGNGHKKALHFDHPPRRVVSLVPSLTESLFDLGLGESVVGVTDYCAEPAASLEGIPRIGGPKNPRLPEILGLQPELVLANQEENTRQAVEALEMAGLRVLVTFPKTVRQALDVLWMLVGVYGDRAAAMRLETLEITVDWAEAALGERQPKACFCPIWEDATSDGQPWWMTFNHQTYAHDVLRLAGGENVFGGRARRYPLGADLGTEAPQDPGERDTRYPRLTLDEARAADPEVILLPSEPFPFTERHLDVFRTRLEGTRAAQQGRILLVDGSLLTWHGTRLGKALSVLPALLAEV